MREDEQYIQDLVAWLQKFDLFPFDQASPIIRTLQLAISATDELITDFNSVLASEETILIPSCDSGSSVTLPRSMSQYLWPNAWRLTKGKNDQTSMH